MWMEDMTCAWVLKVHATTHGMSGCRMASENPRPSSANVRRARAILSTTSGGRPATFRLASRFLASRRLASGVLGCLVMSSPWSLHAGRDMFSRGGTRAPEDPKKMCGSV